MGVDWADPLATQSPALGAYDDQLGSWLSSLINRNKNTISKIVAPIVGTVGTVVTAGGAAPILGTVLTTASSLFSAGADPKSFAPPPATSPPPAAAPAQKPSVLPLVIVGALLMARR